VGHQKAYKLERFLSGELAKVIPAVSGVGVPMRYKSELKIRQAWRIIASGHRQWEQTGSIEPEHLATVRKVQIDAAQHLAKFEDGPAVLFTAWSKRHQLRHIEQIASDLICLSEQHAATCASHVEHGGS
jgi:hypothetical protein